MKPTIHADPQKRHIPDLRPERFKNPASIKDNTVTQHGNTALIFGASGITGWALVNQALQYPTSETFKAVIGLTHRPLSLEDAQFPTDSRIQIHSGIDLSNGDVLVDELQKVSGIEQVTHVYFAAYTGHGSSFEELKKANVKILSNALTAVEYLCPDLQFFTLQTGGKAYGVEFTEHVRIPVPTPESTPRIPEPWASNIFYYAQYDLIHAQSMGKSWKFCEIRPDVIVGFVPQNNGMNAAQAIGLLLSLYRSIEGKGAEVPFPGDEAAWKSKRVDTSQDILARFHLFTSFHAEKVHTKAFNIADGPVISWSSIWPGICQHFGLKGTGPNEGVTSGARWVEQHKADWGKFEDENNLKKGAFEGTSFEFMTGIIGGAKVDRQYDLGASREIGFTEETDTVKSYHTAFDRMRKAKIIP